MITSMKKKKTWAMGGFLVAVGLLITACAGNTTDPTATNGEGGLSGEVTVWGLTMNEDGIAAWDSIVAAFEEIEPNVSIVLETRGIDPHKDALRQVAGTPTGPDIYQYWSGSGLGGELVRAGLSMDLTDYYEQYGWQDRFADTTLSGITQYGGFHGVPQKQVAEGLFYNKALFAQAGITELPTTYDELLAAVDKLKASGITPIQFGGTVNWHVMRLLDNLIETKCGADKADELNKADGDWSAEQCVTDAFTELKKWGDDYLVDGFMAMNNDDSSQLFFSGDAAMALEGTWFDSVTINAGMDSANVGLFHFPTGTGRVYGFGEAYYINANSDNPDAAAAFLDFFTSEQGQLLAGDAFSSLSVNKAVDSSDNSALAPVWIDMFNTATGTFQNNDMNFSTAMTTEYWRIQNSVLLGETDPADAGAAFQDWRSANG